MAPDDLKTTQKRGDSMKEITSTQQFEQEVLNSANPVFVDFWATWCGPCQMVSPIVEELAKEYEDKVNFVKVDVDQNKELASKYNILINPFFNPYTISSKTISLFSNNPEMQ